MQPVNHPVDDTATSVSNKALGRRRLADNTPDELTAWEFKKAVKNVNLRLTTQTQKYIFCNFKQSVQ